ncbi:arsenate reductase ArsC [bacterium]|nr:arsenate reductase ArsC [bacterium]MBU1982970.1 arsenate reductase ArsC [bacterium]
MFRRRRPSHILFLCVANSARSQLAEGIARHFAPTGVRISSAGSHPGRIRPETIAVLAEIGIDASGQYSKGVEEIETESVEAVITLCAEEVCPMFPGDIVRLHWALPDPAATIGKPEEILSAFRKTRDQLIRRITRLF